MISLPLIGLVLGTMLLTVGTYSLAAYRGVPSSKRTSGALVILGNGTMATVFVGFEGAFDLVGDPGLPHVVSDLLLLFSLACLVGSWLVRRRSDR